MYPNIIRTLNISPETKVSKVIYWEENLKNWWKFNSGKDEFGDVEIKITDFKEYKDITLRKLKKYLDKNNYVIACNGVIFDNTSPGIFPSIVSEWYDERLSFRKLSKKYFSENDKKLGRLYDSKQYTSKINLNILYGYLALIVGRFYDKDLAEAITVTGRYDIQYASQIANKFLQKYGEKDYVLYIHTDSIFLHLGDIANDSNIKELCLEVQDYTNQSLVEFNRKMLSVSDNKYMSLKQEIIARTALFVAKNRNALWVINKDGRDVDEIEIKGINIVSTSFPLAFKTILKDILYNILYLKPQHEIDAKLIGFKRHLSEETIYNLGINKTINGIEKYITSDGYAKGCPIQVKSAINYNRLLKHFGLTVKCGKIKSGEKAKYVYLKENEYGYETIAFPENCPEKIEEFIKEFVDCERVFVGELLNKIKDFYNACGWEIPEDISPKKVKKERKKKNEN